MRRIFIAGHNGMVGSALVRRLQDVADVEVVGADRSELDLLDQLAVFDFLERGDFEAVYVAAARVGGIHANSHYPADFIYDNLTIQNNLIYGSFRAGIQRLLFLGSSCIYPGLAAQPMAETALLGGPLEPTNAPYAIAKIAGIKLCESLNRQHDVDYRSIMPTNLYGVNDNFHPQNSHVIPALIRRFHEAKVTGAETVNIWGSGVARREFLCVDDMADACVFVMDQNRELLHQHISPSLSHLNIGTGEEISIRELAETVARVTGFTGKLVFDRSKPDGAPRKLLDVTRMSGLGWHYRIGLGQGLRDTYAWFCEELKAGHALRS